MGLVLPFDSPEASLEVAGGKGTNLSRLVRAGFPVPPGFFVSTEAYRVFVHANQLQPLIVELASSDQRPTGEVSADIRRLFEQGTVPSEVAGQIQQLYFELPQGTEGPRSVAVRSSVTAEDLPGASFAGQEDSFLNVRGPEALLEAVKGKPVDGPRCGVTQAVEGEPPSVSLEVVVQVGARRSGRNRVHRRPGHGRPGRDHNRRGLRQLPPFRSTVEGLRRWSRPAEPLTYAGSTGSARALGRHVSENHLTTQFELNTERSD